MQRSHELITSQSNLSAKLSTFHWNLRVRWFHYVIDLSKAESWVQSPTPTELSRLTIILMSCIDNKYTKTIKYPTVCLIYLIKWPLILVKIPQFYYTSLNILGISPQEVWVQNFHWFWKYQGLILKVFIFHTGSGRYVTTLGGGRGVQSTHTDI